MSAQGRLLSECGLLAKQTTPSVFARPDEDDVMRWSALIVGPPHSPYSCGLFHFGARRRFARAANEARLISAPPALRVPAPPDIRFPTDYPNSPPRVLITTTSSGSVRFNPNFYSTGKVCLSILGTWRGDTAPPAAARPARACALTSAPTPCERARPPPAAAAESPGEQWSSVQNVLSVLHSLQSLMHDKPYHNEPDFEKDDGSGDVQRYNDKVLHETLRVAVVEVLEDTLKARAHPNGAVPAFADLRKQLFAVHFGNHLAALERWIASPDSAVHEGRQFKMMPFEHSSNGMSGAFCWAELKARLLAVKAQLEAELDGWRQAGAEQAALLRAGSAIGLAPAVSALAEQFGRLQADGVDNVSISPSTANALVWHLSLIGPEGTVWEGGCFELELVFPPSWPDLCGAPRAARSAERPLCARGMASSAPDAPFPPSRMRPPLPTRSARRACNL